MRGDWQRKLGLRHAVLQAGLGGGLAGAALATAVSSAGGLGTLGLMPAPILEREIRSLRAACGQRPFAVNLLMPFLQPAHVRVCLRERPPVVILFFGFDRRLVKRLRTAGILVLHQIGSAAQAQRALADGAHGLIVQGSQAGGHLAGRERLELLLPRLRRLHPQALLLAAGGIHDAASARAAMALDADGVVAGTRFLLTPESQAHPAYQARLLAATETLRTQLFGLGWPADHRVVPNAATERWCRPSGAGPGWARALNAVAVAGRRVMSMEAAVPMVRLQQLRVPLYSPAALTREMDPATIDTTPLYAGECVAQIAALKPAAEVVGELAAGLH